MTRRDTFRKKYGAEAEEKGLELVLIITQSLYKSRKTLNEKAFDHNMRLCKKILRKTEESEDVRFLLGETPQHWTDMHDLFALAIPNLIVQTFATDAARTRVPTSSSALMVQNYDILVKDLELLNNILLIGRNILATNQHAQDLAGESLLEQQVLKLIGLCVRVTATGYDGDAGSRAEQQWGHVIGYYKKLLITCLQFLYNFVQENEQRKLLLWLDLFANSKVEKEYAAGTLPPGLSRDHFAAKLGNSQENENRKSDANQDDGQVQSSSTAEAATASITQKSRVKLKSRQSGDEDARRLWADHLKDKQTYIDTFSSFDQMSITNADENPATNPHPSRHEKSPNRKAGSTSTPVHQASDTPSKTTTEPDLLFGAVKTERGDEFGALRTPQSAAIVLQAAKDQLMARLADSNALDDEEEELTSRLTNEGEQHDQELPRLEEDDAYKSPGEPGYQEPGLLTDIPLVLGPKEIEALPMLIQIGICAGKGTIMHGRDMQGMRCNFLLAGPSGRNLLRELLIFIAAWDLREHDFYFSLMMQIMGAILENGLIPFAYQTFAEVKDIVSPAQSMVIKILTQIFRAKQLPTTGTTARTAGNVHADASRRVDIYIVRYIFTIFRQCIIPETCALIYLQGQIKAGHALPEDFPLNLWDMERVYEGVYQFLEFFAVLTESEEWKELLINWEVVSELVTLLRELEASIPKSTSLSPMPHALVEAQAAAHRQDTQSSQPATTIPTPVAVERPFDLDPTMPTAENLSHPDPNLPGSSPLSQSDSQEQDALDAADPSDFEWRNLKKLVILVLSSLVWKSPKVQDQIRQYGGVEMVLACCCYDGNNPFIREHAVMCLRFLLEGSEKNKELVKNIETAGTPVIRSGEPSGDGGEQVYPPA